jgi:hypothetical protein
VTDDPERLTVIDDDGSLVEVPARGAPGLLHLPHEPAWLARHRARLNKGRTGYYRPRQPDDPAPPEDLEDEDDQRYASHAHIDGRDLPPWPGPTYPGRAGWDPDEATARMLQAHKRGGGASPTKPTPQDWDGPPVPSPLSKGGEVDGRPNA